MGSRAWTGATLGLVAVLTSASDYAQNAPAPPPLDHGLTEGVETRLVQFELRVFRKGAPVSGLGAADFDIELDGKPLRRFTVDDMCVAAPSSELQSIVSRPGGFVLYFDGPELTMDGRHRAIEVARLVAPALLSRGHELLVLRNGDSLRAETRWTHDGAEVTAALDRIAADPGHRGVSRNDADQVRAENLLERLEDALRVAEMEFQRDQAADDLRQNTVNNLPKPSKSSSGVMSKLAAPAERKKLPGKDRQRMAMEERNAVLRNSTITQLIGELQPVLQDQLRRVDRDIDRLRSVIGFMALRESPKGVVYFADTLRRDPGSAVVRTVESAKLISRDLSDSRWLASIAPWDADPEFQALVRDSSTYGVRFYAVEGRGLAMPSNWLRSSQDTLASMALETGGLSFLNGIAPSRIAEQVAADQSCWYLVSFPPGSLDTDRPLRLGVWAKKSGSRVQTRSSLVIPSKATLTQTRLIAAHFDDPALLDQPLSVSVYPVGGTKKHLEVLAQVRLPDNGVPSAAQAAWDVGIDVVSEGTVVAHHANRVAWNGAGPPPVYQTTLSLPSGSYEIVAVAREAATDSIRAGRIFGAWPPSTSDHVLLSGTALAQPQNGGIARDGNAKSSGIVVRGAGNPVDARVPVAFVTAACVEAGTDAVFRAERRIVGETEVAFAPMVLSPDEGRCVQIRDLVAAGSLGPGRLTYFVRILSGDDELAAQELAFDVAELRTP